MVEYEADDPTGGLTQEQVLWKNVENYERIILDAARDKVDQIFINFLMFSTDSVGILKEHLFVQG